MFPRFFFFFFTSSIRTNTRASLSSISCWIFWNIFVTSFPLYRKWAQLPTKITLVWSRTSSNWMRWDKRSQVYLWKPLWEQAVAVYLNKLPIGVPARRGVHFKIKHMTGGRRSSWWSNSNKWSSSYRLDSLIDSFWARALHSDVFPVPGGPTCGGRTQSDKLLFDVHELWQHLTLTARTTIPN